MMSIKIGDIVELMPVSARNRQLRKQDGMTDWEVMQIRSTQCFDGEIGFDIKALGSSKSRWVQRHEISVRICRENRH